MNKNTLLYILFFVFMQFPVCYGKQRAKPAAERGNLYLNLLKGKKIALVGNQTSKVGDLHLLDFLLKNNVDVKLVFSPEHGFRGNADAGEKVLNGKDQKTGISIISLYGKNKKPKKQDLQGVDIVVFDIQDVGVRFYTYISSLHYIMEACAENNIECIILDRPNPNASYIDGPVLEKEFKSFVGMHPVPVVYGMTIGEYGLMINGEGWLKNNLHCDLKVIKCANWKHDAAYELPIKPSPNLPNTQSINLYPSLCFFEGTVVSAGRGTDFPFQVYGHPLLDKNFTYTPRSITGASKYPKFKGKLCGGVDLRSNSLELSDQLNLEYLISAYNSIGDNTDFFNPFFEKLAGTAKLRKQIENNLSEDEIRKSWQSGLVQFKKMREKYLLY